MFIAFEGIEGTGKSTQIRRVAERLKALGQEVVVTREPGGSILAEELRRFVVEGEPDRMDAHTELLIFTAARRDHIANTIRPALEAGKIVLCDRYLGSTLALQFDVDRQTILDTHNAFCFGLMPDITVMLELTAEAGLERALARNGGVGENRMEAKGLGYHTKVARNYRELAESDPSWIGIDAAGTPEAVEARIMNRLLPAIDEKAAA